MPPATPLRACNPTPRRLRAARVWAFERIDMIAVQPDLPEHKLDSGGSFRVPGCGGRGCGDSRMAVIAKFGKRYFAANPKKRVQRVEDSLAQSGARPQCGFHISPQRTTRGKHSKANAFTQKRTHAAPPTPFSVPAFPRLLRPPSGSPHENAQARSELIKPDNRTTLENALMAITTHGGIGTEHNASRSVWRYAANSRRERTQDIPIEPYDRRERTQDIPIGT